jgi:hypothetical protein
LSDAVEYPAGARPSKCIIIIIIRRRENKIWYDEIRNGQAEAKRELNEPVGRNRESGCPTKVGPQRPRQLFQGKEQVLM